MYNLHSAFFYALLYSEAPRDTLIHSPNLPPSPDFLSTCVQTFIFLSGQNSRNNDQGQTVILSEPHYNFGLVYPERKGLVIARVAKKTPVPLHRYPRTTAIKKMPSKTGKGLIDGRSAAISFFTKCRSGGIGRRASFRD